MKIDLFKYLHKPLTIFTAIVVVLNLLALVYVSLVDKNSGTFVIALVIYIPALLAMYATYLLFLIFLVMDLVKRNFDDLKKLLTSMILYLIIEVGVSRLQNTDPIFMGIIRIFRYIFTGSYT